MSGLLQFGIRLGRDRLRTLLARLGDPHEKLRCVHVAGTNGKGSTTTFIAAILQAAGYKVGAYLSPYVFDLRERIQINGRLIPRDDFARWVTTIRPHIERSTRANRRTARSRCRARAPESAVVTNHCRAFSDQNED